MQPQLKDQKWVSPQRGLPVNDTKGSQAINSVTGETVQLYYWNSGTRTIDAGQAAGTLVEGKLAYSNILNSAGSMLAVFQDKSLSFTSTAFTTEVPLNFESAEIADALSGSARLTAINASVNAGAGFSNGQYAVDYRTGMVYGRKADTSVTLTSTAYKAPQSSSAAGGSAGGIFAEDSANASGDNGMHLLSVRQDTLASSTSTDGDYQDVKSDSIGAVYGREVYAPTYEDNAVGVAKVEQRFSYSYISTATTTTIKSGAGFLHTITITEAVASTIIVYDNTAGSGTIIASFVASADVGTYHLNVSFGTGLTIVTAGASKITTSYR